MIDEIEAEHYIGCRASIVRYGIYKWKDYIAFRIRIKEVGRVIEIFAVQCILQCLCNGEIRQVIAKRLEVSGIAISCRPAIVIVGSSASGKSPPQIRTDGIENSFKIRIRFKAAGKPEIINRFEVSLAGVEAEHRPVDIRYGIGGVDGSGDGTLRIRRQ
jgi:hypothetical protein